MSTSCQQIYVRAKQSSPSNADLLPTPGDVLARIEADQQALFASLASVARDRFQVVQTLTSTSGTAARIFDLSPLTSRPVERILQLTLADGREVHQVDVLDVEAELAPRFIVRGQTIVEVGNDWSTAGGSITATLIYVYGPIKLDVSATAQLGQLVGVPDEWADLLVLPLRIHFFYLREPNDRTPDELADMQQRLSDRRQAFLDYLTNYGGVRSDRFDIPAPANKK